ncbi:dihydroxyacetone kinase subunit DhaK, partial [Muricomes intestini]|uniref:dihydroxyacetone kinase subunit DhaK n=1 Tax=Muricomes intestini TaxID=1796634 RepID=UPI002FE17323
MKKLINRPETVVSEMCNGIAMTNPDVVFYPKYKVIQRKNLNPDKVSLISGGGSGHEPAHAGYVGRGMLDAAVCGDVFASPSQIQVYQAIKETKSKKGTLLIIKNYSGDVMNFKNGAALAAEEGIDVDYVKVSDDIAVSDSLYTVGRRGVAGTVLVHKIAGAAAENGCSLEEVKQAAQSAADAVRSLGFAYSSCTVPAKGSPTFNIGEDEMEYGVGIHGEPGIRRENIVSADKMAERMLNAILKDLDVKKENEVVLLVNGFGSTPLQELYIFSDALLKCLDQRKVNVYRSFAGNFMTSIDMQGASVSVMKLDGTLKKYLHMPSEALAFRVDGPVPPIRYRSVSTGENENVPEEFTRESSWGEVKENRISLNNIKYMVAEMAECILKNEVAFCELDSFAGDGDFGMSVAKGFLQLKREWDMILTEEAETIGEFLKACSLVIMEYCGGASGPIWGSAFRAAGFQAGDRVSLDTSEFAAMMQAAVVGIQKTGERSFGRGAVVGDKTLIDALVPCVDSLNASSDSGSSAEEMLEKGAAAAVEGAEKTAG